MHSNSLRTFPGFKALSAVALLALLGCGATEGSADGEDDHGSPKGTLETPVLEVTTARTFGSAPPAGAAAGGESLGTATETLSSGHGIGYQNGAVMSGVVHVYYIWYGTWAGNTATTILADLANNLSGSPRYAINKQYDDQFGGQVSGAVTFAGSTTDAYSQGSALSIDNIAAVVSSAIAGGRLPKDTQGVYFVLTSSDVTQANTASEAFCGASPNGYCGWHTSAQIVGSDIKFAFIGNGEQCPGVCPTPALSPNGNPGADEMASVIVHELDEAVTDPHLDAWFDWIPPAGPNSGWGRLENADKCAWNFGAGYTVANGSQANVRLGNRDFRIQQNWVNDGSGYCGIKPPVTNAQISCAFNWAESQYSYLFSPPAPGVLLSSPPYMYRYFPATNSYLGAAWPGGGISSDRHIYYMGPDGSITDEGLASYWIDLAHCP